MTADKESGSLGGSNVGLVEDAHRAVQQSRTLGAGTIAPFPGTAHIGTDIVLTEGGIGAGIAGRAAAAAPLSQKAKFTVVRTHPYRLRGVFYGANQLLLGYRSRQRERAYNSARQPDL